MNERPEQLTIRPPSEWRSILIRLSRGCPWNRCKFCGIYSALGEPDHSIRTVAEVKADIDWYRTHLEGLTTAFLGDADPLGRPLPESIEILRYLRTTLPHLSRVTAYARASTLYKLGFDKMKQLKDAGLDRIHTGLETGNKELLKFHIKGQSPKLIVQSGLWTRLAGIELSYYILLGIGGLEHWQKHVDDTAEIINRTDPDFIRLRRLWLYTASESGLPRLSSPLLHDVENSRFTPQTPEGTIHELHRLIDHIDTVHSELVCDHGNNYLTIAGTFPGDKKRMLEQIQEFLSLPEEIRTAHYEKTGSEI